MDFLEVGDGIVKIDPPNREINQSNAKHNAKN
jgi:hypothetical protein